MLTFSRLSRCAELTAKGRSINLAYPDVSCARNPRERVPPSLSPLSHLFQFTKIRDRDDAHACVCVRACMHAVAVRDLAHVCVHALARVCAKAMSDRLLRRMTFAKGK